MQNVTEKKIIIGNWKMNPVSFKDALKIINDITKTITNTKNTNVVICPPFLYIEKLKKISKKIFMGAQDSFGLDAGPFTGEISAEMLYGVGARYVILGHSERRETGETGIIINKKIKGALSGGLVPILCVGEKSRDDNHEYFNFVKNQLEECLQGLSRNAISKVIIAYEPVWAISTTEGHRDANPKDCEEMIIFIKKVLFDKFGAKTQLPKVIYGGSVNEKDAAAFIVQGGAEGLLVGKASLNPKKFIQIIKTCETLNN